MEIKIWLSHIFLDYDWINVWCGSVSERGETSYLFLYLGVTLFTKVPI